MRILGRQAVHQLTIVVAFALHVRQAVSDNLQKYLRWLHPQPSLFSIWSEIKAQKVSNQSMSNFVFGQDSYSSVPSEHASSPNLMQTN